MTARVKLLKELVGDELYVIDHAAVAEALVVRSSARRLLPGVSFASGAAPAKPVRSFRPYRSASRFRLSRGERRSLRARSEDLRAAA